MIIVSGVYWKGGGDISVNADVNQSLEYCSRLIRQLEEQMEIPENKFTGRTASALREAQEIQVRKLKEIRDLLEYLS